MLCWSAFIYHNLRADRGSPPNFIRTNQAKKFHYFMLIHDFHCPLSAHLFCHWKSDWGVIIFIIRFISDSWRCTNIDIIYSIGNFLVNFFWDIGHFCYRTRLVKDVQSLLHLWEGGLSRLSQSQSTPPPHFCEQAERRCSCFHSPASYYWQDVINWRVKIAPVAAPPPFFSRTTIWK